MKRVNHNTKDSKNWKLESDFMEFCLENPNLRFWQALRAWAKVGYIFVGNERKLLEDTFYWEGRNK